MFANAQEMVNDPKNSHTERQWQKKFFALGCRCYYCSTPLTLKEATKDHRIPTCRGGSDKIRNIVPACLPCNQKKSWRTEAEFRDANPTLCTKPQERRCKTKLEPSTDLPTERNLEVIHDKPFLLEQLRKEAEPGSWAWKHPA